MLGLFLLYFIGKKFYELAERFDQNKWLYAILSVITYYGLGFGLTMIIALLDVMVFEWNFDWESRFGMNLLVVPFGLVSAWGLYMFLENRWKKKIIVVKDEIQDIGKNIEDKD